MTRRLLFRFTAILAVVGFAIAIMFGRQPLVVALVVFGAFALSTSNANARARDAPMWRSHEARRRRAHERSQKYLYLMSMAPNWPDPGGRVHSSSGKRFLQYVSGAIGNSAKGAGQLHSSSNYAYYARDQPWGFRPLIGTYDPAPSVP